MEDYSLRSQVFQAIREDILKGKYKQHDELREATLGRELGVSRTRCERRCVSWSWKGWSRSYRIRAPM